MSTRAVSLSLAGLAVLEACAAAVLAVVADMTFHEALDAFVVTNGLMGASFAVCGGLISWHRPGNVVGWLFVADGVGHATSAWVAPFAELVREQGGPDSIQRLAVTVLMYSWPWSIGLFLPLALLLFPDGRTVSPRWRWAVWAVVLTSPLFVLEMGLSTEPISSGLPSGYLTSGHYDDLAAVWTAAEIRTSLALAVAVLSLVVRYRNGGEEHRRQLLWLLLSALIVVGVVVPWSFVSGTPVVVLFAIPLIPVAVTVAIVRDRLLDIRLVVSRALVWMALSLAALAAYVGLVAALDRFVSARVGDSALVTVVVALGLAPALPRLQRAVNRLLYGDRGDPARVAYRVGAHLVSGGQRGLDEVAAAIRSALRLPYVAVTTTGTTIAASGEPSAVSAALPLMYAGDQVGTIEVGLRAGERRLSAADAGTLGVIAASLAIAVRSMELSTELQRSREHIVMTREEERRRIRQDLHDGLGPALTGVALQADAAANLVQVDPMASQELLRSLGRETREAITDVRRLVDDLRPAALDELGLLEALRQRVDHLAWRPDGTTLDVRLAMPATMPALPAAVEVAAYRIATEALTNVARHSHAARATLALRCDQVLELEVLDDGRLDVPWTPGVGLTGMRERAVEVGGSFEAGPTSCGGRVYASIPLDAA